MFVYGVLVEPQPATTKVTSGEPQQRDAGLRLDPARFRRELRIRGATAGAVARAAHVSPNTLTRCRNGSPISERTLREVVRVLVAMPVLHGASDLVTVETRNAAARDNAAALEGGRTSASTAE
jgi:hypothetical protein